MNEIELLFVEPLNWDHWGLPVVRVDGAEYAVADDEEQAQKAALECAREDLWAFNSEWICCQLGLESKHAQAIKKMQEKLCEDAQPIMLLLLGDKVDNILTEALNTDGRGHTLSPYDGEEQDGEHVSPALEGKLVYRIN
jgi:hypothetical protein